MKRGKLGFPQPTKQRTTVLIKADPKSGNKTYYFRNAVIKERTINRTVHELEGLKDAKSKIGEEPTNESLFLLLKNSGGFFDPREQGSFGLVTSAKLLRAFNDHEVFITHNGRPYLMWLPSTTGLAQGEKMKPITAYVSGTETINIPGRGSQPITVLLTISDDALKKAVSLSSSSSDSDSRSLEGELVRKWTSGKYSIMAKLVGLSDDSVTLRATGGKDKVVPISKLSEKDREYLKNLE